MKYSTWIPLLLACCLAGCNGGGASPENFPVKTVQIICPWAAGGGTDRVSRFWADALKKEFGKAFVVVNRTGGSGVTGHSAGARAKPDGYTITTITAELNTMHQMGMTDLTYRDFHCLMQVNADAAAIIVRKDAPWNTLREFLDYIKENPQKIRMSGTATRGTWDLARAGLLLADGQQVDSVIWKPTQGAAPSLLELIGGHIDAVCCSVPEAASQIKGGELKVLAVMSKERLSDFPDIPTCKEQGVDWVAVGWRGLALPKETPPAVVEKLQAACKKIAESEGYREFMKTNGFGVTIRDSKQFTAFLEEQDKQWKKVIQAAGYQQK